MPLPAVIEIIPPRQPIQAHLSVPGSKSLTNRALILAALAQGETRLQGALRSEDTQVMTDCLHRLGFEIRVKPDAQESCNRTITVQGLGGVIPKGGTEPLELFVGNAGTAARFLAAFVCLGQGVYRLSGVERMHSRPQGALFKALRELGYQVDAASDRLPAIFHGRGPHAGSCKVSITESSQFASALLLCAQVGKWDVQVEGQDAEEMPYVTLTQKLISAFHGGVYPIEADASSASYFCAADWVLKSQGLGSVTMAGFPESDWQIDTAFPRFLPLPAEVSRHKDLGDSIMTAIVLAPLAQRPTRFTGLERLRLQECERVQALRTELTKCGAVVHEEGETLTIEPAGNALHGAEIETYNDHRMAMCFAILGLKVSGIKIKNPSCVKKTFPNFFQKLGASAGGLGVTVLNSQNGKRLLGDDLFAK